ncbi:MAG: MFS transporter, partial [Actinobacteria bacterium]|nr:MFS transporter [Actinomycetota bacterium]
IANFVAGRLSDSVDIKKIVLTGLFLLFLGFALFGTYLNYVIFVIVTIFLRVGFGIIDTSVHSFSSKLFKKDISQIFLKLSIAWFSGTILGSLVISGVLYFEFLPGYLFLIFAFSYVIFIVIFYKICPKKRTEEDLSAHNKDAPGARRSSLGVLKDPSIIMASLVLFLFLGSLTGLSTWLTTYFLGLGIRVAYGSAILSLYWLFSIIGTVITSKIVSKYKEVDVLFYSCLAGIIFLAVFCFIPFIYMKIMALSLQAICFATIFPLANTIAAKRDPKNTGTVLGFTIAFTFAGSIVFQPLYGYITEYFGKEYIAYIALAGVLIGFVFVAILFKIIKNENSRSSA